MLPYNISMVACPTVSLQRSFVLELSTSAMVPVIISIFRLAALPLHRNQGMDH